MGKAQRTGPTALTTSAANILNGGGGNASMRDRIKHVHVANRSSNPVTFSLFLGATGGTVAGTEVFPAKQIPANDTMNEYMDLPLASTEFLVALASANTSLTLIIEYEREVV